MKKKATQLREAVMGRLLDDRSSPYLLDIARKLPDETWQRVSDTLEEQDAARKL